MTAMRDHSGPPGSDATAARSDEWQRKGVRRSTPRSRMGGVWIILISAAFVLLLLLIFILQNGQPAQVSFLGAHGTLPMGVALLLAAIFGVLLVAVPGTVRILQLRSAGRRALAARPTVDQPAVHPRTPEGPSESRP